MGWTCSVCGEQHDEQLRDIRMSFPEAVFGLSGAEREERAEVGDDWCRYIDKGGREHFYARGVLHLPIEHSSDDFRFGVWVEVGKEDFHRLGDLWHDEEDPTRPFFGRLANELSPYDGTVGLPVALQLRAEPHLPAVILLDAVHQIVTDQRAGIGEARAQQLAETVHH